MKLLISMFLACSLAGCASGPTESELEYYQKGVRVGEAGQRWWVEYYKSEAAWMRSLFIDQSERCGVVTREYIQLMDAEVDCE